MLHPSSLQSANKSIMGAFKSFLLVFLHSIWQVKFLYILACRGMEGGAILTTATKPGHSSLFLF
jgi:hypothetical protein